MPFCWAGCAVTLLLSVGMATRAHAQQAKPDEPGTITYRGNIGKTVMGGAIVEDLKIGPPHGGMSRVTVGVGSPGCAGGTSGMASVQGDMLLLATADDGSECRLTIRRTANGATIKEESCITDHGASCDFNSGKPLSRVR